MQYDTLEVGTHMDNIDEILDPIFKTEPNFNRYLRRSDYARKRHHCGLYRLSADSRCSMDIFLANRVSQRAKQVAKMTLYNAYRPWWMSFNQYQAMLTRLGVPF